MTCYDMTNMKILLASAYTPPGSNLKLDEKKRGNVALASRPQHARCRHTSPHVMLPTRSFSTLQMPGDQDFSDSNSELDSE